MDRLASLVVLCGCLLVVLMVAGSGIGAATTGSTVGSVSTSVADAETESADSSTNDSVNVTAVDSTAENVTVTVEDAEPFEFGTTVAVHEETLTSMTFQADESEVAGNVSVRANRSIPADTLGENRTLHNAIDVTVPDSATDVPATLRLVVAAYPVEHRENLEVMRHTNGEWEPLDTEVISNRTWSSDRGASVLLLEAETPGFSTFAVTETTETTTDSDAEQVDEQEAEAETGTAFAPPPEAEIYRISDRRPFDSGTHVHIHEETVREITFQDDVEGFVAINETNATAVSELREERAVIRALNITATENASQTPATLHLAVRAIAVDNRDDVEVMRYDADGESWEPLETAVVSDRYWSADHEATILDVEAETPGFSTFAITERPDDPEPDETAVDETDDGADETDESADDETDDAADEEADNGGLLFGFGLLEIAVVVVVLLGGTGAVVVVRKR